LSREDSGGEAEVQSTPNGFAPKTPYVGMVFDSFDAALSHYNIYAKHVVFSVKIESSRRCAKDGEKDKSVFVCNIYAKQVEKEAIPIKQRA
jgi:hypothetical protein